MMFLQDLIQAAFRLSDRHSSDEGIPSRESDLILFDTLGYYINAGNEGATSTNPIDTQGRVKKEDFLTINAALEVTAKALLDRANNAAPLRTTKPGA